MLVALCSLVGITSLALALSQVLFSLGTGTLLSSRETCRRATSSSSTSAGAQEVAGLVEWLDSKARVFDTPLPYGVGSGAGVTHDPLGRG